jgi:hypothetical protein
MRLHYDGQEKYEKKKAKNEKKQDSKLTTKMKNV